MPRNLLGPSAPNVRTQTTFGLQIVMVTDDNEPVQIGTAVKATPSHKRTNTRVGGVGIGDRIMEYVPGLTSYTLSIEKFAMWNKVIQQIFGFDPRVRMLAEMQKPFDVYTYHLNPVGTTEKGLFSNNGLVEDANIITTIYRDCVISTWDRSQEYKEEVTIVDNMEVDVTRIEGPPPGNLPQLSNLY